MEIGVKEHLTVGALAGVAGVNLQTIRYYERRGLLRDPRRVGAGYRLYSEDDVRRVRFIKRAQGLGFTLREIGEPYGLGWAPAAGFNATDGDLSSRPEPFAPCAGGPPAGRAWR